MKAAAIAGHICSGKSTVIQAVSRVYNADVVSFGKFVRDEANERQLPIERATLQQLGEELFELMGPETLIVRARNLAQPITGRHIYDGVRHPDVYKALVRLYKDTCLIVLDVPDQIRHERCIKAAREVPSQLSSFRALSEHPIERGIDDLKEIATVVIDASSSSIEVTERVIAELAKAGWLSE